MIKNLLAFGEILFDIYPSGAKIGGAPLNFASHFAALGNNSAIYSAVGDDEYGKSALDFLANRQIDSSFTAVLSERPTGFCSVTYNKSNGEPQYDLARGVAYDFIDDRFFGNISDSLDLFYYGSLALRDRRSRDTAEKLIRKVKAFDGCQVFCDLNLRGSFYTPETVEFCLENADIAKLNREEYSYCVRSFVENADDDMRKNAESLCRRFAIKRLLITLDSDGSFLYDACGDKAYRHGNAPSSFVSAVGAGDSFSACFLHNFLDNANAQAALEKASVLSAFVVSTEESVPEYTPELIRKIM